MPLVRVLATDDLLPIAKGGAEGAGALRRAGQSLDRAGAVFRLPHGGRATGLQQEHGAAAVSDPGLAGEEAAGRPPATSRSLAVEGTGTESALGNRLVPRLGRPGQLGEPGGGHRLPHARAAGLAPVTHGPCDDGQCCAGASADRSVRHAGARSGAVSAAIRQWLGLHESELHGTGSQLRFEAGIHHAALPAAERHGGARDPIAEGAMRTPASFRNLAACEPRDQRLDCLLQPSAPASGAEDENTR